MLSDSFLQKQSIAQVSWSWPIFSFQVITWNPSPLEQTVICDNLEVQALPGQTNPLQHLKLSSSSWKALHGFLNQKFLVKNLKLSVIWETQIGLETKFCWRMVPVQADSSWLMSSYKISSSPISYQAGNFWKKSSTPDELICQVATKFPSWMETAMKFQQHDYSVQTSNKSCRFELMRLIIF